MTSNPQDLSLCEQAEGVRSGALDAGALLDATLARIEERNPALGAIVETFPDHSREMLAAAPEGPLHGVPIAIKDMFQLPWRGPRDGTEHEELPAGESGMYRALRDAGAVLMGVTNMHANGAGTTGHESAYGPVGTPWDPRRVGGGSSGGSASAVGARMVAGAVGTDGGGSVRIPASYCGVSGLKLTFGSTVREGFTHGFLTLDESGALCRDAADTRLLAATMAGVELAPGEGAGLKVGIVPQMWADIDPEVEAGCRALLDAGGWEVCEIELEGIDHALIATILSLAIEGLPNLRTDDPPNIVSAALSKYIQLIPARIVPRIQRVRAQLRRAAARAFGEVDLLVWPTLPTTAPLIEDPSVDLPSGKSTADKANVRLNGFANLTGVPAASAPAGLTSAGLPFGLMLHGPWGEDARVLDAMEHLETATDRRFVDAQPPLAGQAG